MTDKNKENKKPIETKPIETTGHEWDGISEYNIGAPRWWLIVWIVSIIWSFGYWIFYPTWPTSSGNSKGSLGWTQQSQLKESQSEIDILRAENLKKISELGFDEIKNNKSLYDFALNSGRVAFKENCAACHGTGAQGAKGYPNLNDDDWLWGGKITDIYQTLIYGIRSSHDKTRFSQMPSFGLDKVLNKEEISEVADYVLALSGKAQPTKKGEALFKANCVACHGSEGKGGREFGAPNLADAIWLYGGIKEDVIYSITYSRAGVMPYWTTRLDEVTIKQLALYVHSLGGGE